MDWTQAFAIIASLGAFIFWIFTKLDADIKSCNADIKASNQRVDRLYQMFVDLLRKDK